ncbi:MAG TPA: hypothetical protein VJA27_02590 [Patescibacteria group bacterium]|nr:hypothetical protein [Patescibacteria group bacterium]
MNEGETPNVQSLAKIKIQPAQYWPFISGIIVVSLLSGLDYTNKILIGFFLYLLIFIITYIIAKATRHREYIGMFKGATEDMLAAIVALLVILLSDTFLTKQNLAFINEKSYIFVLLILAINTFGRLTSNKILKAINFIRFSLDQHPKKVLAALLLLIVPILVLLLSPRLINIGVLLLGIIIFGAPALFVVILFSAFIPRVDKYIDKIIRPK